MNLEELKAIFAANLISQRQKANLTQAELAAQIHYSDKSVSKWERGEAVPDIGILYTLSEIYGVTVAELIGQTEKSKETLEKLKAVEKDRKALERAKKKALERAKKQKKKK